MGDPYSRDIARTVLAQIVVTHLVHLIEYAFLKKRTEGLHGRPELDIGCDHVLIRGWAGWLVESQSGAFGRLLLMSGHWHPHS